MDSFISPRKVKKLKPIHWVLIFVFSILTLAWMLLDTSSGVSYRHSVRHGDAANRVLHLDDDYRKKLQSIDSQLKQYCDRGSDIVFGHNLLINDMKYYQSFTKFKNLVILTIKILDILV